MRMSLRGSGALAPRPKQSPHIYEQEIASSLLAKRGVPRNDIKKEFDYAILTIFQKSVKPIGFHSKPETVLRTPNSAAGWYRTA
jgi:hypothetical protein